MQPWELGVTDSARLIHERQLSATELVESLLDRIELLDSKLQAWVTVDRDAALTTARTIDATAPAPHTPLSGVPIGLKDVILTKGLLTTASSKSLADFIPEKDATVTTNLRESGSIVLGKLHTAEYALADPPPTRNAWNLEHTPGGSSSGSGAAVAAGMVPVALGTQTGGSTLRPAAYNGLVGLKPTYGLISCTGVLPVAWSFDTVGILARSVEDVAYVLDSIAAYDPADPASRSEREESYLLGDNGRLDAPLRIGLVRSFFFETSTPEVRAHTEEVAKSFERAGASVREVALPSSFDQIHACFRAIFNGEVAAAHKERFADRGALYGPKIAALIEQGLDEPAVTYIEALRERPSLANPLEAILDDVDVLLMPTTPAPAPADRSTTGDASFLSPWTFVGVPTISVPSGIAGDGLPLGVQLVGKRGRDFAMLQAAQWCADVLAFNLHPASWNL